MDEHKIVNHENECGRAFPHFDRVEGDALDVLRERIYSLFFKNYNIKLPDEMIKTQRVVVSKYQKNAAEKDFMLDECFRYFGVCPKERVYVNWRCFDELDRLLAVDLVSDFSSIWYPESDDIEIFDEELSWMVAIAHDGVVELRFRL
ncbi:MULTISPECIES: hypothetical protein [Pseudomonas]|uniref:hypothetical protein n=1 Tax=Pseudomonas TaxID=286 RepID=UPI000CD56F94|nr:MULTISPECIES: hypothetical protein [Pseudomonas]RBH52727.1 hypothetical protein C3F00_031065 [Pseudomonas sp. MWU13-2860]